LGKKYIFPKWWFIGDESHGLFVKKHLEQIQEMLGNIQQNIFAHGDLPYRNYEKHRINKSKFFWWCCDR